MAHLTEVGLTNNSLEHRMAITKAGQVTWANPALAKRCTDCVHFAGQKGKPDMGVCRLVKIHRGPKSKQKATTFHGASAWACSMFEARQ